MPIGRSTTARRLRPFPPAYRARKDGTAVRITAGPEPSADRSGTAADSSTITGTVAGRKAAPDAVSATITSSGTAVGQEHHFGKVTASVTSSATVVGKEGHRGTAAGTITSSGTVVGQEHHFGTVSATTTITGTVAGREGHRGLVAASTTSTGTAVGSRVSRAVIASTITSTGVVVGGEHHFGQVVGSIETDGQVVGSKVDGGGGDTPAPPATGGAGYYAPKFAPPVPAAPVAKRGRVVSAGVIVGGCRGARGARGAATGAITTACTVQHRSGRRSVLLSRIILRSTTRGVVGVRSPEYLAQHAQRARDDDELTLMLL